MSFAQACAEAGADVVLAARRVEKLDATAALVRDTGRRALTVATDVGDAATLIGETGLLAPPGDPEALANAIRALSREPPERRSERGRRARGRIVENFSLDQARQRFAGLYAMLLTEKAASA